MATIGDVQEIVGNRYAALLAQAQALAGDAFTPSSEQAMAWALRALGYPAASLRYVTEAELAAVAADRLDALLDLTELRMLESIQTGFTAVTVKAGPVQEDYNHLADRLDKIVGEKRANVAARHGQWLAVTLTSDAPKRATLRAI
jgi:hypothetical protein